MDLLAEAISAERPIRFSSGQTRSVAALVPSKRPDGYITFRLSSSDARYLRIAQNGKVDLNGGRNGTWTLFSASLASTPDSRSVLLRGVNSGRCLRINGGELASTMELDALQIELAPQAGPPTDSCDAPSSVCLRLADGTGCLARLVCIQRLEPFVVLFATETGNLACGPEGKMHWRGGNGKWARWQSEQGPLGIAFRNDGHARFLTVSAAGEPSLANDPSYFVSDGGLQGNMLSSGQGFTVVDPNVLSASDVAQFKAQGYFILKDAIPAEHVRDALRTINYQLGQPDCWEADANPLNAAQLSLKVHPNSGHTIGRDILYKSPRFWSAVNALLGVGNVAHFPGGAQVAVRFPLNLSAGAHDKEDVRRGTKYHIDGMGQNKLCPFTLLCGVALSDQLRPNSGNLHVFPGSHLNPELRKYYVDKIDDDNQNEGDESKPNLGDAVQVLLGKGDVVIAHQLLAHRVGINYAENIRYQLYYRLRHKDHDDLKQRIVHDPWTEFAI